MRVLFVTPYVPSRIRIRPFAFLRELSRRHEVAVLTLWSGEREREDLTELRRLYPTVGVQLTRARALANCVRALPSATPLQGAYARAPEMTRLLRAALAETQGDAAMAPAELRGPYDIVHVEHLRAAHLGAAIPAATPAVVDAVDCISLLLERTRRQSHSARQRLLSAFELPRMRRYEGRVLGRFDAVAVTSPVDGAALQALDPSLDVNVVGNGVDLPDSLGVGVARRPDSIVFAGKMSYHANATAARYFAREVFPLVRARRPLASFHIVGSDPPADVRALANEPSVVVTGYVADLQGYVRGSAVAVAPMLVKVGVQNKVLEAMAAGTPVVATPAGVEGLEAEPGRDLLVGSSPAELAELVVSVLAQAELRARLAEAGRRYVERNHRWEASARALEGIYARVIAARSHRRVAARDA